MYVSFFDNPGNKCPGITIRKGKYGREGRIFRAKKRKIEIVGERKGGISSERKKPVRGRDVNVETFDTD